MTNKPEFTEEQLQWIKENTVELTVEQKRLLEEQKIQEQTAILQEGGGSSTVVGDVLAAVGDGLSAVLDVTTSCACAIGEGIAEGIGSILD